MKRFSPIKPSSAAIPFAAALAAALPLTAAAQQQPGTTEFTPTSPPSITTQFVFTETDAPNHTQPRFILTQTEGSQPHTAPANRIFWRTQTGQLPIMLAQADGKPTRAFTIHDAPQGETTTETFAFLGVVTAPLPDAVRAHTDLPAGIGLIIEHIQPDSPAADAGLQRHDILYKLNEQLLINADQLRTLVRSAGKDAEVNLTVVRKGQPISVTATLDEQTTTQVINDMNDNTFRYFMNPETRKMVEQQMSRARDAAATAKDRIVEMELDKKLSTAKEVLKEKSGELRDYLKNTAEDIDREKLNEWAEEFEEQVTNLDQQLREAATPVRDSARNWLRERGFLAPDENDQANDIRILNQLGDAEETQQQTRASYKDTHHLIEITKSNNTEIIRITDLETGDVTTIGPNTQEAEIKKLPKPVIDKIQLLLNQVGIDTNLHEQLDIDDE